MFLLPFLLLPPSPPTLSLFLLSLPLLWQINVLYVLPNNLQLLSVCLTMVLEPVGPGWDMTGGEMLHLCPVRGGGHIPDRNGSR